MDYKITVVAKHRDGYTKLFHRTLRDTNSLHASWLLSAFLSAIKAAGYKVISSRMVEVSDVSGED